MTNIATSLIAQQAFTELGLRPISSYGDDSPEAVAADQRYSTALDMVLESYDWAIARRMITPPALAVPPTDDPDLAYAFALPGDTLTVRHVFGDLRWRREGHTLRANAATLRALVTVRLTDEGAMTATLRHVIALQLAVLLAPTYAPTRAKRADLETMLTQALMQARMNDRTSASGHQIDGRDPMQAADWPEQVTL